MSSRMTRQLYSILRAQIRRQRKTVKVEVIGAHLGNSTYLQELSRGRTRYYPGLGDSLQAEGPHLLPLLKYPTFL